MYLLFGIIFYPAPLPINRDKELSLIIPSVTLHNKSPCLHRTAPRVFRAEAVKHDAKLSISHKRYSRCCISLRIEYCARLLTTGCGKEPSVVSGKTTSVLHGPYPRATLFRRPIVSPAIEGRIKITDPEAKPPLPFIFRAASSSRSRPETEAAIWMPT